MKSQKCGMKSLILIKVKIQIIFLKMMADFNKLATLSKNLTRDKRSAPFYCSFNIPCDLTSSNSIL